jgi:hypothetical protein
MVRKTVISQLQTVGEGALGKLAQSPATRSAFQGAIQVKERGERLLHVLDSIEARLTAIEKRLAALEKTRPKRAAAAGVRASARTTRAAAGKAKPSA